MAVYEAGVGWIDSYGSYIYTFHEKGVVYFLRDYYVSEIERRGGDAYLQARLDALISHITEWEYAASHAPASLQVVRGGRVGDAQEEGEAR